MAYEVVSPSLRLLVWRIWRLPGILVFPGVTRIFPSSTAPASLSCAVWGSTVLPLWTNTLLYFASAQNVASLLLSFDRRIIITGAASEKALALFGSRDLAALPGNRFEALKGDRKGQYRIRINDRWRICFEWS